jgi:hypothetical protein
MKINPLGIQSYQQLERRDGPTGTVTDGVKSPRAENSVTISPQAASASSRLAVKAPKGDYTEFLTPEERSALEILFRRFNDPARFGPAYQRKADTAGENAMVGHFIDVKV